MSTRKAIAEISELITRYAWAILVTFLTSYLVAVLALKALGLKLMPFLSGFYSLHWKACTGTACLATLIGILTGSLCFPSRSRMLACVTLIIVGLACYQTFWWVYWRHEMANIKHGNYSLLPALISGGLCALAIAKNGTRHEQSMPVER